MAGPSTVDLKPDARASAPIRRDELHPGFLQGSPNVEERAGIGRTLAGFEIRERRRCYAAALGQGAPGPADERSRGPALLGT